jgi:hypothetical protein
VIRQLFRGGDGQPLALVVKSVPRNGGRDRIRSVPEGESEKAAGQVFVRVRRSGSFRPFLRCPVFSSENTDDNSLFLLIGSFRSRTSPNHVCVSACVSLVQEMWASVGPVQSTRRRECLRPTIRRTGFSRSHISDSPA